MCVVFFCNKNRKEAAELDKWLLIFFPMTLHTLFLPEQATLVSHTDHQMVDYYFAVPWVKLFHCLLERTKSHKKQ